MFWLASIVSHCTQTFSYFRLIFLHRYFSRIVLNLGIFSFFFFKLGLVFAKKHTSKFYVFKYRLTFSGFSF